MSNHLIEQLVNEFYNVGKNLPAEKYNVLSEDEQHNISVKLLVEQFYQMFEDDVIEQDANQENLNDDINAENNGKSVLDMSLSGEETNIGQYIRQNTPLIYAFTTDMLKNKVKIGFTTQGLNNRIEQWKKYYPDAKAIGSWTATAFSKEQKKVFFLDHPVHSETMSRGFDNVSKDEFENIFASLAKEDFSFDLSTLEKHYSREFFNNQNSKNEFLTKEVIDEIIEKIKEEISSGETSGIPTYDIESFEKQCSEGKPLSIKNYQMTTLQQEALNNAVDAVKNQNKTHLLLCAIMRFGKVCFGYHLVKELNKHLILVTSAKADTRESWRNDIYHQNLMNDTTNFVFLEFDNLNHKGMILRTDRNAYLKEYIYSSTFINDLHKEEPNSTIIVYVTLQDISGLKDENGEHTIKDRHTELYKTTWEMLITDECHFAIKGKVYGKALGYEDRKYKGSNFDFNQELKDEVEEGDVAQIDDNAEIVTETSEDEQLANIIHQLKSEIQLYLSGTPYNILTTNEFTKEDSAIVGHYSYTDMLAARDKWVLDHPDKHAWESPFFGVPDMIRFGMNLTQECRDNLHKAEKVDKVSDSFSVLFKATGEKDDFKFVYQKAIKELMVSIFGNPKRKTDNKLVGFLNRPEIKEGEVMKHIVICLPSVIACHALAQLLKKHIFIGNNHDREVIIAVDNDYTNSRDKSAVNVNALNAFLNTQESQGRHTVTLTVDRFMTAVSVPLWDALFMMKDTTSAENYDQAVFRIATRNVKEIKDGEGNVISKVNLKPNVYLIDFKVERLFSLMVESSHNQTVIKGEHDINALQDVIREQLKKMPIYIDGVKGKLGQMEELNAKDFIKYYTKYNENKSIDETIKIDKFKNLLSGTKLDDFIYQFDPSKMNKGEKKTDGNEQPGGGTIDIPGGYKDKGNKGKNNGNGNSSEKDNDSDEMKDKKNRAVNMFKNILYFSMCLENCDSLSTMIKIVKDDEESQKMMEDFGLSLKLLEALKNNLHYLELNELDIEIRNIWLLMNDPKRTKIENVNVAVKKMGQIDDQEVPLPDKMADFMVSEADIKEGDKVLVVNEKKCEFLQALYRKYNGNMNIMKNVFVIPSSSMTTNFDKIIMKQLGLDTENVIINNIGNPEYNTEEDFIKNKFFTEDMSKFDYIIQNPPYKGQTHMTFANKGLDMLKDDGKMIIVHPSTWCINIKQMDKGGDVGEYKRRINGHVRKIILDNMGKLFNVGLYVPCSIDYIDFSKKYDEIEFINCGDEQKVKSLNDCNLVGDYSIIKSILDKVEKYPNKFKDHIYVPGKSKVDENTWYTKFVKGQLGGGGIIVAGGHDIGGAISYEQTSAFKNTANGLFRKQYLDSIFSTTYNDILNVPVKTVGPDKKFTDKDGDNLYDTKEHLENWKYNVFNTKLPLFLSIVFTINASNNVKDDMIWLVDKQYTDDEINKLFNFNNDEIEFINKTIQKYERTSKWFKRYMQGI